MSRFLIACGGTGGHLSPGIALAEGFVDRGHEAILLISRKEVDSRLAAKYPRFTFLRAPGVPFSLRPLRFLRFAKEQAGAFVFCLREIRTRRPDVVIGFGGFTTVGVVLAAVFRRIPIALHEGNRVPGRAVRMLSGYADRVYLPPGVLMTRLPLSRICHVGLPVRSEIRRTPSEVARIRLGLDPAAKTLAIFGGSQGAESLNRWVDDNFARLAQSGVQVFCVTGLGRRSEEIRQSPASGRPPVRAIFRTFTDDVADVLSAADLVVSRAGAGTIAELVRAEAPAVLVPYPYSADNHQWINARFFEQQGGGLVIDQKFIHTLADEVLEVIFNDWLLKTFRANLRRMDRQNVLSVILDDLQSLAENRENGKNVGEARAA